MARPLPLNPRSPQCLARIRKQPDGFCAAMGWAEPPAALCSRSSLRQQESAAPQPITNISCLLVGVLRGPFSTHEGTESGLGCCGNP